MTNLRQLHEILPLGGRDVRSQRIVGWCIDHCDSIAVALVLGGSGTSGFSRMHGNTVAGNCWLFAVMAMPGMDVNASLWNRDVAGIALPPLWFALTLIAVVLAGVGLLTWRSRGRSVSARWMRRVDRIVAAVMGLFLRRCGELERLVAERTSALMESEGRYRAMFEKNRSVQWLIDPETGAILEANSAACAFYGYTREQIQRMKVSDINLLEPGKLLREFEAARSERRHSFQFQHRLSNGQIRDVELFSSPIPVNGRQLLYSVIHDVTERTRAEAALQQERARLASIITGTNVGAWEWNVQTGETVFNERWAEMLGYTLEELAPVSIETWLKLAHPDDLKAANAVMERHFRGELEYYSHECRMKHKDGRWVWVLDRGYVAAWTPDGKPLLMHGAHQDITHRKQTEEAIRESESKYRLLIDHSSDLIWSLNAEGIFTYASPSWKRVTGYAPESIVGTPFHLLVHPDDLAKCQKCLRELVQSDGAAPNPEYRVRHADGTWHWHAAAGKPVVGPDGAFLSAVGVSRDITDRKRAELQLQASEKNFRTCFESVGDMIVVFAHSGRLLYANAALLQRLGYAAQDLVSMHYLDLLPAEVQEQAHETYAAVLQGERNTCSLPWQTKAGTTVPVETRVWCGKWNDEDCVFGIAKDVGAEQEAQQRFERLFRNNPALMALSTLPDRTFADVNDAFLRKIGYSREEVLGKTSIELSLFASPAQQAAVAEQFRSCGRVSECELRVRCKDGSVLEGLFSGEVIRNRGRMYLLSVMVDITDRRRAEESLRESEKELKQTVAALESANKALEQSRQSAESATRAKSEFLANMSHEIRTPMTAILGFAEVLLGEEGIREAPPERVEAIRTIQRNGQYLLELINDILDLSKIEAGKLEVERIAFSPMQLLADVTSLMRIRADAKNLPLKLECVGGIPEFIQSDPLRLRQVLINLVGNAIKFTETGSVRMVARLVHRLSLPPLLQVDVVDTGIGLTETQISTLFHPFSQADSSTSRRFGGTGLGLTISKRLAEMLGGGIAVASEPGKGSTFTVTVEAGELGEVRLLDTSAVAPARATPVPSSEDGPAIRLAGRILLAEDGPDNRRLIAFFLKKAGAEVTLAENGQVACNEALAARVRGDPFDLILMDMQMPVMDGYEATRRLRANGFAGPIIALTAHSMEGDRQKCLAVGCTDYATKPVVRQQLLATIARWTNARV